VQSVPLVPDLASRPLPALVAPCASLTSFGGFRVMVSRKIVMPIFSILEMSNTSAVLLYNGHVNDMTSSWLLGKCVPTSPTFVRTK
jgi:hypothetical protein